MTMLAVLAFPCGLILMLTKPSSQQRLDSGAAGIIGLICMLSMLVAVYHHFYDAIILVVPTTAMILRPPVIGNASPSFIAWCWYA